MIEGIVFQNPRLRLLRLITLLVDSFASLQRRAAKRLSASGSLTPLVCVPECRTAMSHAAKRASRLERPNFSQELYICDKLCEQRRGIVFPSDERHRQGEERRAHCCLSIGETDASLVPYRKRTQRWSNCGAKGAYLSLFHWIKLTRQQLRSSSCPFVFAVRAKTKTGIHIECVCVARSGHPDYDVRSETCANLIILTM